MAAKSAQRIEFLADVVISAVEGGTGYWAQVSAYKHSDGPASTFAVLHEIDDDAASGYAATGVRIDGDTIAKGIGVIAKEGFGVNAQLKQTILQASRENDAGEVDAEGADVIVQAALFGEIVYG